MQNKTFIHIQINQNVHKWLLGSIFLTQFPLICSRHFIDKHLDNSSIANPKLTLPQSIVENLVRWLPQFSTHTHTSTNCEWVWVCISSVCVCVCVSAGGQRDSKPWKYADN